jgi:hypothetical protein
MKWKMILSLKTREDLNDIITLVRLSIEKSLSLHLATWHPFIFTRILHDRRASADYKLKKFHCSLSFVLSTRAPVV